MSLVNKEFGLLTVIKVNKSFCECVCHCGKTITVKFWKLKGATNHKPIDSCGCLKGCKATHELYNTWDCMRRRCGDVNSENYKHYGARGIKVCERWENSFASFLKDMRDKPSPKHTLDRIDNDGDYTPQNCRWSTPKEQANNKRTNNLITYQGKTLTLKQWSVVTGINYARLESRFRRGWTPERAFQNSYRHVN